MAPEIPFQKRTEVNRVGLSTGALSTVGRRCTIFLSADLLPRGQGETVHERYHTRLVVNG